MPGLPDWVVGEGSELFVADALVEPESLEVVRVQMSHPSAPANRDCFDLGHQPRSEAPARASSETHRWLTNSQPQWV